MGGGAWGQSLPNLTKASLPRKSDRTVLGITWEIVKNMRVKKKFAPPLNFQQISVLTSELEPEKNRPDVNFAKVNFCFYGKRTFECTFSCCFSFVCRSGLLTGAIVR